MLTLTLTVTGIVTGALLINKAFNKESTIDYSPRNNRIIKKTN